MLYQMIDQSPSCLYTLSKVFERVIYKQLYNYTSTMKTY